VRGARELPHLSGKKMRRQKRKGHSEIQVRRKRCVRNNKKQKNCRIKNRLKTIQLRIKRRKGSVREKVYLFRGRPHGTADEITRYYGGGARTLIAKVGEFNQREETIMRLGEKISQTVR